MKYKESERKIKGQWFTPDNIADEMVNMTPVEWWSNGIFEPTCGNGNLVIRILEEKVKHGLTPQEALNTTWANELEEKYVIECTDRVNKWANDKGIVNTQWKCMNEDAMKYDFRYIPYEYVWTNLPFGSCICAYLPNYITKNVVKCEGIIITKATTFKKYVKDYKIMEFPGIEFKCQISHYDLNCKESKSWLDKYKSLMSDNCKWVVKDNSYTHVVRTMSNAKKFLSITSRNYYDKKGKLTNKAILLKLTDEQYNKLISYSNTKYEEYYKEMRNYINKRNINIIYGYINEALNDKEEQSESKAEI